MTAHITRGFLPTRSALAHRPTAACRAQREAALVAIAAAVGTLVPFLWFAAAFWLMGLLTHVWNLG